MIIKKIQLIAITLLLICQILKAESNKDVLEKYVVFTFEVAHKNTKVKEFYYWITPQDSVAKRNAFEVFPLFTEEYSKDILERCKTGGMVDIFTASTATNFDFDDNYKLQVKNLLSIISINKIKVQDFKKRWFQNGDEVVISVYVSPINGSLCSCLQSHGKATYGFRGVVYLPLMSFSYDEIFWNSKNATIVKNVDYSYVEYSSYFPLSMHDNSNIRVKGSIELY
ncbi:hypothetical protein [Pedobacter sandarakinus]|uniref:hypothetical protein n=1 Tax=Pedobacter sandarakinus TaxID=353156 RepID=UPI002247E7DB|nr:hypothetical protein [Pedobacter sandarakinus]MCX2576372.1 hypothetical protein [Pedobacter sandarakinus]